MGCSHFSGGSTEERSHSRHTEDILCNVCPECLNQGAEPDGKKVAIYGIECAVCTGVIV